MAAISQSTRANNALFSRLKALLAFQKCNHTIAERGRQSQLSSIFGSGSSGSMVETELAILGSVVDMGADGTRNAELRREVDGLREQIKVMAEQQERALDELKQMFLTMRAEQLQDPVQGNGEIHRKVAEEGDIDFSKWRKLDSRKFRISRSMIPAYAWTILKVLQSEGFEAYLVGGCVRDLLLNRIPKDFDIITTARLPQIKEQFHCAKIIGRRFPICTVYLKGSIVEVSSFDTVANHVEGKEEPFAPEMPKGCKQKDFILWKNSMQRDFTINSLFFDPFVNRIYDYANAMVDLRSLKLRTLVPAHLSFEEDCARILRGLRLAARLNLSFSKETENAIHDLSSSIMSLSKSRMMVELNYMLSYGAAEASLSLLQRYNILEIVLPFHGAHLAQQASKQLGESSMMMKLFSSLDKFVTCGQPSNDILWVALLAFHLALITYPQRAVVILTFASLLYHASWKESVIIAKKYSEAATVYVPEISESQGFISDDELAEKVTKLAVQVQKSINILTDSDSLLEAMSKFPGFPCSGLVFVPHRIGLGVELIFNTLVEDVTSLNSQRKSLEIDYNLLRNGNLHETRFVLGKVILDTIAPEVIQEERYILLEVDAQQKEDASEEQFHGNVELEKEYVSEDDNELTENYELEHNRTEKQNLIQQGCDTLEEGETKKQKIFVVKQSTEMAVKKRDQVDDKKFLSQILDCSYNNVTTKENKGEHGQLPQDGIRMVLEGEKKYQLECSNVTGKEKTNDDKYQQQTAVSHLNLLLKDATTKEHKSTEKCDSSQELSIDEVSELLDSKNHKYQGKKLESGENSKQKGSKRTLSALFR